MTQQDLKIYNPIVNWILGGLCTCFLGITAYFLVQIHKDFEDMQRTINGALITQGQYEVRIKANEEGIRENSRKIEQIRRD